MRLRMFDETCLPSPCSTLVETGGRQPLSILGWYTTFCQSLVCSASASLAFDVTTRHYLACVFEIEGNAIMNPKIDEKVLQFEAFINDVLKADLGKIEEKLDSKNADLAEFTQLKSIISTLRDNDFDKSGFKTQVDIGQNFFVEAHVPDASRILLDVGLSHYVEFTLDEALVVINVRSKLLERQIAHLRKEIARTNAHIKLMLLGIKDLQGLSD
ncbi:hypothetical protein KM043_002114 [Ampulex compressa]|nr:hypothetical protein KM043_002114 [Ampulex compressa]